jgi:hypothetical protein
MTDDKKIDDSLEDKVEDTGDLPENNLKVETASVPLNLTPPDPDASGPWIEYNGIATVRIITEHDWRVQGIDSTTYCEWNYLNNKRLPKSMFSEAELKYLLTVDGRFQLVEDESVSETTE